MVVSAGERITRPGFEADSAWRLDTKTGDLEFCTYSLLAGGARPSELIACSTPAKAHPSDLKVLYYDAHGNRVTGAEQGWSIKRTN